MLKSINKILKIFITIQIIINNILGSVNLKWKLALEKRERFRFAFLKNYSKKRVSQKDVGVYALKNVF